MSQVFEWYSYKLVVFGSIKTGYYEDYQAVPTITHAPSARSVRKAIGVTPGEECIIIRGPMLDGFTLAGDPPVIPNSRRKCPKMWEPKQETYSVR